MTRKDKRGPAAGLVGVDPAAGGKPEIETSGWVKAEAKSLRKDFPDATAANEPLRIAMTAEASAEIAAHAKESLDAEVCGVLVGHACEDDAGPWVWVKAAIRGDSARQGGAHVTYTQETWRKIHEAKDRKFPQLSIVGWYHSHPGFGVEFSAMDMFIQENFFSAPSQIALVLDPLSGDEAVCVNTPDGAEHAAHFWVDGRRRTCRRPAKEPPAGEAPAGDAPDAARRLRAVEERLQQVLQATDEERAVRHFWRMTLGMLLALGLIAWIGMTIARPLLTRETPPEDFFYDEIPVRIGNEDLLVGVKIVKWKIPAKLHEAFLQALQQQLEAEAKEREEAKQAEAKEAAAKTDGKAKGGTDEKAKTKADDKAKPAGDDKAKEKKS